MDKSLDREAHLLTPTQAAAFLRDILPPGSPFSSAVDVEHAPVNSATRKVLALARYGGLRHIRAVGKRRIYFTPAALRAYVSSKPEFLNGDTRRDGNVE